MYREAILQSNFKKIREKTISVQKILIGHMQPEIRALRINLRMLNPHPDLQPTLQLNLHPDLHPDLPANQKQTGDKEFLL